MNSEFDMLDDLFGTVKTWRGYRVRWCDLCRVYVMCCQKCKGTSCNCKCCDSCRKDQEDFQALKPWPEYYMSEAERKVIVKYWRYHHLLAECIIENQSGLDLEWCYKQGKFCPNDWETLGLTFPPYE